MLRRCFMYLFALFELLIISNDKSWLSVDRKSNGTGYLPLTYTLMPNAWFSNEQRRQANEWQKQKQMMSWQLWRSFTKGRGLSDTSSLCRHGISLVLCHCFALCTIERCPDAIIPLMLSVCVQRWQGHPVVDTNSVIFRENATSSIKNWSYKFSTQINSTISGPTYQSGDRSV